ncbi:hypothetical protein D3C73_700230 [compost metagenome]
MMEEIAVRFVKPPLDVLLGGQPFAQCVQRVVAFESLDDRVGDHVRPAAECADENGGIENPRVFIRSASLCNPVNVDQAGLGQVLVSHST